MTPHDSLEYGFSTIRLVTEPGGRPAKPVGVVAWDAAREWYQIQLLEAEETPRSISKRRLQLARLAERDLHKWADDGRVPYAEGESRPWEGRFWEAVHAVLASGVRMDAPTAMQPMTDPAEEFPLLFEAVAKPRSGASRRRIGSYLTRALGSDIEKRMVKRGTITAFHQHPEKVNRLATGPEGTVIVEGVSLAGPQARKDADALQSRLSRILNYHEPGRLHVFVGFLSSPNGLNGEADLKAWFEHTVAHNRTFDLIGQRPSLRGATLEALRGIGLVGPNLLDQGGDVE